MRPIRALMAMLALLLAAPVFAQTMPVMPAGPAGPVMPAGPVVTSAGPDKVSLTLYRGSRGGEDEPLDLDWLQGYALVTETRTVHIPAGRSVIRFEGVAGGVFPESLVIAGLPDGVLEKNLDADLLSPRSLYARSFGRPVTLTHRNANGTMVSERAIIRSGPDGAAIFETRDGFIAADCTGREAIAYDAVPDGLSAKPTLSIETRSPEARDVTITLSYLAWGFDWQVNYVATMRPDGQSADLTAWITLASGDVTSFVNAETLLIAGRIYRDQSEDEDADRRTRFAGDQPLHFQCMATHVDRIVAEPVTVDAITAEDVGALPQSLKRNSSGVVDAITAEDIGDYKLYRVPERTTVASNSQKQVQLFDRAAVPVQIVYRAEANGISVGDVETVLRARNREDRGLGIPLPRGMVALFEPLGDRRLLIGESTLGDIPVGQDVELRMADSTQVSASYVPVPPKRGWESQVMMVTNANPYPVRFEARIDYRDYPEPDPRPRPPHVRGDAPLTYQYGDAFWTIEIPANSSVTLRLRK